MFLFAPTEENVLKVQIFPQLKPIFQSGERVVHKEIQESFDLITKVLKTELYKVESTGKFDFWADNIV